MVCGGVLRGGAGDKSGDEEEVKMTKGIKKEEERQAGREKKKSNDTLLHLREKASPTSPYLTILHKIFIHS